MQQKIYTCECGKTFTEPNKFNGHKSNCEVHRTLKGTWELRTIHAHYAGQKSKEAAEKRAQAKLEQWISEQHTCEKCGKIMTEKYGSGRFCSRACANSHDRTEESKQKISQIMRQKEINSSKSLLPRYSSGNIKEYRLTEEYLANPDRCVICGSPILHRYRNKRKTCGKESECYSLLRSNIRINTINERGIHHNTLHRYKHGFYKGIECDSSWELAFLLYHLDKGNNIERNKKGFIYYINESPHQYFPDFIIDGIYYEIKGYKDETVPYKLEQFPKDKTLIMIDKDSIYPYLKFARTSYGDDFALIYDIDKPNWFSNIGSD